MFFKEQLTDVTIGIKHSEYKHKAYHTKDREKIIEYELEGHPTEQITENKEVKLHNTIDRIDKRVDKICANVINIEKKIKDELQLSEDKIKIKLNDIDNKIENLHNDINNFICQFNKNN